MVAVPGRSRKVKTGCFTCKARRVKCDEERPWCRRCVSGGRKCEGYYATISLNSERRGEPPSALLLLPDCSEQERRYFHLYHVVTVPSLCSYFGSNFWTILMPQVSICEPAVRHSLLALSALHESISYPGGPEHLKDRTNASTILAVVHYNKAIRSLIRKDNQLSPDTILLCCVVFVCVELLRGNVKAALDHIQSGLKVLQDVRSRTANPRPFCISSHPSTLEDSLDTVFARLDIQSMLLGSTPQLVLSAPNASHPNTSSPITATGIPLTFSNIPEARAHFETLLSSNYRFMRAYPGLQPDETLSSEAAEAHRVEVLKLQAWSDAFRPLFEGSKTCSAPIQRTAQILKIQHTSSMIWACAHNRRSEAEYGAYTTEFADIVELARRVVGGEDQAPLKDESSHAAATKSVGRYARPDFAFDTGIVPALHLTAMKCRVPRIRHEALALLKLTPRQEGVCDRAFVAKLTAYSIEAEEAANRLHEVMSDGFDAEKRPSVTQKESFSSQDSDQQQPVPEIRINQQVPHTASHAASTGTLGSSQLAAMDTWDPQAGLFTDEQLLERDSRQSSLCHREKHSPQHESVVRAVKREIDVSNDWQRDHLDPGGHLEVRSRERPWDVDQQGVARRASNGQVTELKEGGIMGFDANSNSYSFDYRGI